MAEPEKGLEIRASNSVGAKEFFQLVKKTNKKNPAKEDVVALRECLENHPELWREVGDLASLAALRLIEEVCSTPAMKESMLAGRKALKEVLGYRFSNSLVQLLIEHVVLCWLRLNWIEYQYTNVTSHSITLTMAQHWEKRLSAAQHRYLRACESLARVRKLARNTPALQVNIGEKQVNVAGCG